MPKNFPALENMTYTYSDIVAALANQPTLEECRRQGERNRLANESRSKRAVRKVLKTKGPISAKRAGKRFQALQG